MAETHSDEPANDASLITAEWNTDAGDILDNLRAVCAQAELQSGYVPGHLDVLEAHADLARIATPAPPPVLDLAPYPAARLFVARFAKKPWNWTPLWALADYLEEQNAADTAGKLRTWIAEAQAGEYGRVFLAEIAWGTMTRTARRSLLANVRRRLREAFGDYDKEERESAIPF